MIKNKNRFRLAGLLQFLVLKLKNVSLRGTSLQITSHNAQKEPKKVLYVLMSYFSKLVSFDYLRKRFFF